MRTILIALTLATAQTAVTDGYADVAAGEKQFRKCQSCHVVTDPDGTVLTGKSRRRSPNLFGIVGRRAGTVDGFGYKAAIVAAGGAGLVWTETELAKYLMDPTKYLRTYLDDKSARSAMSFRVRKEQEAADLAAFLATFAANGE